MQVNNKPTLQDFVMVLHFKVTVFPVLTLNIFSSYS